ncbi:hypothetical protein BCR37DRAFT_408374 [Protomyces lactucae-debilis]|uniref:DUF4385 domain containing protein n=1 Tax=Protomyces lactucae-debilis TaxID=2754530 RepID=A0A1Y2FIX9_PROLT|nr:uncharacterized protein BCR37DRAFT_408374 [Protomyces lactucae-debilis]ORY83883.1 hypothetical protein BCR37DRAFT_408374 [Protomyces lactucae-debilis]
MPRVATVKKAARAKFDYSLDFPHVNMRASPHLYRIGIGEQGVLSVEPYKSELLPLWRFKTPDVARESSQLLKEAFDKYKVERDFIGMDMTRKFIQMGVTRARRYANWPGGKKYAGTIDAKGKRETVVKGPENPIKAESARIFGEVLATVKDDDLYQKLAAEHKDQYERQDAGKVVMSGKEKEAIGKRSQASQKIKHEPEVDSVNPQVTDEDDERIPEPTNARRTRSRKTTVKDE